MSHLAAEKGALLKRVKRIAGQVQAIEKALVDEADCAATLFLVASARGAMNGLLDEIIKPGRFINRPRHPRKAAFAS